MSTEHTDYVKFRGGTPDERDPQSEPYSAASYSAQYGIPIEDAREMLESPDVKTHGDMRRAIYIDFLRDPEFRAASGVLAVRPLEDQSRWGHDAITYLRVQATTPKEAEEYAKMPAPIKTL